MNAKKIAADAAVARIEDGMIVGLGTGSTAYYAIHGIADRIRNEGLRIKAVASSAASERLAEELGIPLVPFADIDGIDVTIDGADEADPSLNLIKGGGGALLREKILAANSREFLVIVDESKLVPTLGAFPLPVEIIPFAKEWTVSHLRKLGCEPTLRQADGKLFVTDNGNYIADCRFQAIADPESLASRIQSIPGVVEHGLFVKLAHAVFAGRQDGTVARLG